MNIFRQIVSGPKNRYRDDDFNLDLTYITPRIIAMAYPAQGFQKFYRNSIEDVAKLLHKKHGKNYQVINISGRQTNKQKLLNVSSYYWEDHKTPQIQTLFVICENMMNYLSESQKRVSVVHCNHGKGRTGTLICCFLLYSGFFKTAQEALKFYANRRYQKEGYGVTQPCQIKYIHYFNQILRSETPLFPSVIAISRIQIKGSHDMSNPYFKLKDVEGDEYIFNTNNNDFPILQIVKENQYIVKLKNPIFFKGDMILQIKHHPLVGKNLVANYPFNTTFLDRKEKKISISMQELSPLSAVKSGIFQKNLKISIEYRYICSCHSSFEFDDFCQKCQPYLKIQEEKWNRIYKILENKPKHDSKKILYGRLSYKQGQKSEEERTFSY